MDITSVIGDIMPLLHCCQYRYYHAAWILYNIVEKFNVQKRKQLPIICRYICFCLHRSQNSAAFATFHL